MTVKAKSIIQAFYGDAPKKSYFSACSAGGRQGLMEAQRFPEDYDGIIAGAPASDWTGRAASSLRVGQAVRKDAASYIPPEKYRLIHEAALRTCDALDGVKDGLITDPTKCQFDPQVLACKTDDAATPAAASRNTTCLTPPQVEAARAIYATKLNSKTGRESTALMPGSELGWGTWAGPNVFGIGFDHFRYVVFKNPGWDPLTFNFDADIVTAEEIDGGTINALNPDLRPFFERKGRLIQYHGWNDPQISPGSSVNYYKSVVSTLGGATNVDPNYRLFMAPGMAHCSGGEGPNVFDMLTPLEDWVEHQHPRIESSRPTRPTACPTVHAPCAHTHKSRPTTDPEIPTTPQASSARHRDGTRLSRWDYCIDLVLAGLNGYRFGL